MNRNHGWFWKAQVYLKSCESAAGAPRRALPRRAVCWQSSAETGLDIAGVHVPNRYCSFSHWSVMTSSSSNYPGRHKLPPSSHTKNTMIWSAVQCMQRRTAPDIKDPLPISICTWFLTFSSFKYQFWWTWLLTFLYFELDFSAWCSLYNSSLK